MAPDVMLFFTCQPDKEMVLYMYENDRKRIKRRRLIRSVCMAENYKCPGCGASLIYEAGSDFLVCPYCDTRVTVSDLRDEAKRERDSSSKEREAGNAFAGEQETSPEDKEAGNAFAGKDSEEDTRQFRCSNCGGELVTDAYTAATVCPFCGSPSIIRARLSGRDKPDVLIPFAIGRDEAKKRFLDWTKKGLFTPRGFCRQSTLDGISGLYVPYWLFDFHTSVHMDAAATKVRTIRKGEYEYTYTDHFLLTRDTDVEFEKIPNDASQKMPDDTMERLEPFEYGKLTEFELPYLSGYLAERANCSAEELEPRARERAGEYARRATRDTMTGYTTVTVTASDIRTKKQRQQYAMLPVWVLSCRYRGKDWQLYINGQTGRRIGSLPVDGTRVAACFGLCSAVIFALSALIWGIVL